MAPYYNLTPVIEKVNGEFTVTFTVDANTIVTSNVDEDGTHLHLIANGISNSTATHTLTFSAGYIDFSHYLENSMDLASIDGALTQQVAKKPRKLIIR